MQQERHRDTFKSRLGFILACTGSAVGLGNLWMFPWRLGEYGGAAFLLPYLLFVYVLGTTGLMAEFAFGRWAQRGAMGAYDKALRERGLGFGRLLGTYPVLALLGTLVFYLIVTGWVLRYLTSAITGALFQSGASHVYFNAFAGHPESVYWQALACMITGGIVVFGISKGIEKASKVLMPLLLALLAILLIRAMMLPGSAAGLRYVLIPDWSYLFKPMTWAMALGQAFFSVSLTGAGMVVYGSYLSRDFDIPHAALSTVTLDTAAALMAALIIIPATFAYGVNPAAGPPLLFIALVNVFANMPAGQLMAITFFCGVLFAALSSLLAIQEVVVEAVMDQFFWSRKVSVMVTAMVAFLFGVPLAINQAAFDRFVHIVTIYLGPGGAAMAGALFFWVLGAQKARAEVNMGARRPVGPWWEPVGKYLFVGVAMLIIALAMALQIT